jgi:uncharacterized protein (TIGR02145 family)
MKKSLFKLCLMLEIMVYIMPFSVNSQGIAINASGVDPHPSSMLDVDANNKGFLPPRLTTVQRDGIVAPATGLIIYNTDTKCINTFDGVGWRENCGVITYPLIASLDCSSATNTGTLTANVVASGVNSVIPYTGGNGNSYNGQTVASTGVTGLTASLLSGTLLSGSGTITYSITGTPLSSGTANFALNIGGQSCVLAWTVSGSSSWPSGSVFCSGLPTAIVEVINPITGKTWMDRNLGATQAATSSTDANAYGDLYQWGRFADGHQCRNSLSTSALSTSDTPGHADFIINNTSPYDWRNSQNDNLWQGVNGVNNPCPAGYRIPTDSELNDERLSWTISNSAGAFASNLKLTLAGYKMYSDGNLYHVGARGRYWSSTTNIAANNVFLGFQSGNAYYYNGYRGYGLSVRCIKN